MFAPFAQKIMLYRRSQALKPQSVLEPPVQKTAPIATKLTNVKSATKDMNWAPLDHVWKVKVLLIQ